MADSFDGLKIKIAGEYEDVDKGLNALVKSLEQLKKSTGTLGKTLDTVDFESLNSGVTKLSKALQPLQGFKSQAGGLISSLGKFTTSATRLNEFAEFDKFSEQIELLADSLAPLANFRTQLGATLQSLGEVPQIAETLEKLDFTAFSEKIKELYNSLLPLGEINSKLGSTLNQLTRFVQVAFQLDESFENTNIEGNILRLAKALKPLVDLGKSSLGSVLNQLGKLPKIMEDLEKIDLESFAIQIEKVAFAIKPLADEMEKVANGFSAFPSKIQKIIKQNEQMARSNSSLNKSYNVLGVGINRTHVKLGALLVITNRVAKSAGDWFNKSNEYIENLHLFRLSMDGATESALKYAYTVQEKMGIDVSEWMRYQAVFQNMTKGFGITEEKASIMSRSLTQLGYDLSAVFNVDYETSMRKLESAIAGQPRPMREWGFDISETTLKMVAMNLGIEKNVELMTQMEKAQLRFVQLMETSRKQGYLGDMARTIMTPANAIRILEQQFLQLKRALGEMLIPVLTQILPYFIALTRVVTDLSKAVATALGFELPQIDYSGVNDMRESIGDVGDTADDATDSLKKLKRVTLGFDELNIVSQGNELDQFARGIDDLGLDLSKYMYDFLGEIDTTVEKIENKFRPVVEWLSENMSTILSVTKEIGTILLAWKIGEALFTGLDDVQSKIDLIGESDTIRKSLSMLLVIGGAKLLYDSGFSIMYDGGSAKNLAQALLSTAAIIGGSLLISSSPTGWVVGISVSLAMFIVGATLGERKKMHEMVKNEFYQGGNAIQLSDIAIEVDKPLITLSQENTKNSLYTEIDGIKVPNTAISLSTPKVSADREEVEESLGKSFKTITLSEIAINFEAFTSNVTENMEDVIKGQKTINDLKSSVSATNKEIDKITTAWERGIISTETYSAEMKKLIEQLNQETTGILDEIHDNILMALGGAFGEAVEKAGYEIPEVVQTLNKTVDENKAKIQEMTQRFSELNEKLGETGQLTKEEWEELAKLRNEFVQGDQPVKDAMVNLQNLNLHIGAIDWQSRAEADLFFKSIGDGATNAKDKVKEYSEGLIEQFEQLRDDATSEELKIYWDEMIVVAKGMEEEKIAEIEQSLTTIFDAMQTDMIVKSASVADKALKEWNEKAWWEKLFSGGKEKYVNKALVDYQKNVMTPLLEEMEASMEKVGIKGGTFANEAMDEVLKAMFDYQPTTAGLYVAGFSKNLTEDTKEKLAKYGIDAEKYAESAGLQLAQGLEKGVDEGVKRNKFSEFFARIGQVFRKDYDIKSPSGVFEEYGRYVAEGLRDGVDEGVKEEDYKNVFQRIETSIKNLFDIKSPSGVFEQIGIFLGEGLLKGMKSKEKEIVNAWANVPKDINEKTLVPFEKHVEDTLDSVKESFQLTAVSIEVDFSEALANTKEEWGTFPYWTKTNVLEPVLKSTGKLTFTIDEESKDVRKGVNKAWGNLSTWFDSLMSNTTDVVKDSLGDWGDMFANSFTESVMSFTGFGDLFEKEVGNPVLKILGDIIKQLIKMTALAAFKWIVKITFPELAFFADGGFPEQGSLFVAREAGAELVGTIGNRTAVVNNDQIVESVSRGVYDAVVSAMGTNQATSGKQVTEVRVYLDGRDITRSVEAEQRERGLDLMPGGVLVGR